MKKIILVILLISVSFCFGFFFRTIFIKSKDSTKITQTGNMMKQKKVTGVAGIFFKCKDPQKIREWYKTHLGLNTNDYGATFEWQEGDPAVRGLLQWSPFSETDNYFAPSTKEFMINYRVENLTALVEQLKKEGVTILDQIETYDYGKFIHIMDIEGNKIELFEPNYEHGKDGVTE